MAFDAIIVETMLPSWPLLDRQTREAVAKATTAHVKRAIAAAPLHVNLAVGVLSFAIGLLLLVVCFGAGRGAVRQLKAERLYSFLQRLPGPTAAAVRLYRSMSLLAFYEHPAVAPLLLTVNSREARA